MCKTSTTTSSTNQRVQCDQCDKQFVNKAVLKKHINAIHKNIYLFKCPHQNCQRTFRTGYRLYVHELFHKGIKPFKCSFCGKGFAEKGTLKVQLESHSTVRYYNCEYCSYGCKTESHLREHYKVKHNKFE